MYVIAWVVLKVALAVTSVALHLLWVAAVVMFVVWVIGLLHTQSFWLVLQAANRLTDGERLREMLREPFRFPA